VGAISPCTADQSSHDGLLLTGLVIWMGDGSKEYKEPLSALLQISENSPTTILRFATKTCLASMCCDVLFKRQSRLLRIHAGLIAHSRKPLVLRHRRDSNVSM
jgi:hypothetical protein